MNTGSVCCPACRLPLPGSSFGTAELTTCPGCGRSILVEIFPALFRPIATARPGETILEEGVASCFYHAQKKATSSCDLCGRFLCALCDIEFNQQHLCPNCLESGQAKGKLASLETQRVVWDSASLSLCLMPILVWPVTFLTAPLALGCAIYSFFRPTSLARSTRYRAYLAVVLSLMQIAAWVLAFTGGLKLLASPTVSGPL